MKILHLTLKKQWFDMIASGEKREEYREMKAYWVTRLTHETRVTEEEWGNEYTFTPKEYDVIRFRLGYAKGCPEMDVECLGLQIAEGLKEWGAQPDTQYFVLHLGRILSRTNF